jgi:hypothetical protein
LVVECLDLAACMILDGEWAAARERIWPEAFSVSHSRHTARYGVPPRRLEDIGRDYLRDLESGVGDRDHRHRHHGYHRDHRHGEVA